MVYIEPGKGVAAVHPDIKAKTSACKIDAGQQYADTGLKIFKGGAVYVPNPYWYKGASDHNTVQHANGFVADPSIVKGDLLVKCHIPVSTMGASFRVTLEELAGALKYYGYDPHNVIVSMPRCCSRVPYDQMVTTANANIGSTVQVMAFEVYAIGAAVENMPS